MTVLASNNNKKTDNETKNKQVNHALPVLDTLPANDDDQVLVDTEIRINFNIDDKNYKRFRNHLEKEKYKLELNNQEVDSYFDIEQNAIILNNFELTPYNRYTLTLSVKANANNSNNSSENATYSFSFNTVAIEGQTMKIIKDDFGTEYKIVGYGEEVRNVKVYKDTSVLIDEVLTEKNRFPVAQAGAVRIDLPEDVNAVLLMSTFLEEPETVLKVNKDDNTLEWLSFSIDEATGETSFCVFQDMTFIPIRYDLSAVTQSQIMSIASEGQYATEATAQSSVGRRFNILSNDNGDIKVELTFLKENWDEYRWKLDDDGDPELFAEIDNGPLYGKKVKAISDTTLTFDFDTFIDDVYAIHVYEFDVQEKDPRQTIWKQDVLLQGLFSISDNDIEYLAKKFAPILLYHDDESYYPMSIEHMFQEISELDKSITFKLKDPYDPKLRINCSQVEEFMSYNGHSDVVFSMGNMPVSSHFARITGTEDQAAVYYSFFQKGDKFYLNYHFIYAYDLKSMTVFSIGSHNFDRESMTLEFEGSANIEDIEPINVIVGGHLDDQQLTLLGENKPGAARYESWDNVRVRIPYEEFKSPYSEHVVVNIAQGSHAIYPVSGWYEVLGLAEPAGLTESILSNERLNISNNRILFPEDELYNNESTYTLLDLNLDNMEGRNPLNFSGYWVDVLAPGTNAKFPPFTERERDVSDWCDKASSFNLENIPSVSKRTIEEFNKVYLFSKLAVKDFIAVQDSNGVTLSWTPFSDINKYKVYKKNNVSGQPEDIFEVTTSFFIDGDVVPGQTYSYEIEGIFELNTESGITVDIPCKKTAITVQVQDTSIASGKVIGTVKSALNNEPITNAIISIDNGSAGSVNTDSNGVFEANVTAEQPHKLTVSKTGYTSVTYYNVRVEEDETVHIETILQIPEEYANKNGTVTGRILSALSGYGIGGATLRVRESMNNQSGAVIKEVTTASDGRFVLTELPSGNYTAEVTSDNIITCYFNFVCIGDQNTNRGDIPVTTKLSDEEIRIVLSWGANPRDLDSHISGNDLHVYYAHKNEPGINLDVDDVTSYGPETVTINLNQVQHGIYTYYVHHYSGSGTLGTSGANVKVYSGNQLIKEYNVPSSETDRYWSVFRINTETLQIETITTDISQLNQNIINSETDSSDISTINDELELILNDIEKNKKIE